MIVYHVGDILKMKEFSVIPHGCNCSGGFGSGLAAQIAKEYPLVKEEYLHAYSLGEVKLGNIQVSTQKDGRVIVNCFTQQKYGRPDQGPYVSYEAIRSCAAAVYDRFYCEDVAWPKIGAGLAGGNWEIIEDIIVQEAEKAGVDQVNFVEYYDEHS